MNDQENQLIREMTTDLGPFEEPEPVETNVSNETSDTRRLDWLQNEALGASVNSTLDDLVGKGWTSIRAAIDKKRSAQ